MAGHLLGAEPSTSHVFVLLTAGTFKPAVLHLVPGISVIHLIVPNSLLTLALCMCCLLSLLLPSLPHLVFILTEMSSPPGSLPCICLHLD